MLHKDTSNQVFLLGGHDLEMLEIRRLLKQEGVRYVDRSLSWDKARLSAYLDIIQRAPECQYLGVELKEDCGLPAHYIRIDHHNDYNDRPASILQVASLLDVKPDRHLLLVAANDAGYIPAMQALGASETEIIDIRRRDRVAQGVTEEDERLAEKSIAENLAIYGDLLIVRSQTSCFSPICDRLYPYRRLLIYTDSEWVFYGDGKRKLVSRMAADIAIGMIYHGGGDFGYIGAARGAYDKPRIIDFVKSIIQQYV